MFKGYSIHKKLILIFVPLTLASTLLLSSVFYWIFTSRMSEVMVKHVSERVDQASRHTDTYLEELIRLSVLPYYNPEILKILEMNQPVSADQYNIVTGLINNAISNPREDLQGVFIYRTDGTLFSGTVYEANFNDNYDFHTTGWFQKTVAQKGKAVLFVDGEDRRVLNRPNTAFSVARSIKLYDGPILGTIVIDANYKKLEELFQKADLGEDSNLLVVSDDNKMIYSKNSLYISSLSSIISSDNPKALQLKIGNQDMVVGSAKSTLTGWKIIGVVPKTSINQSIQDIREIIVAVSILMIVIISVSCIWFSYTITRPLRMLKNLMGEVAKGNYSVSFTLTGGIEVADVGRAFNRMSQQINDLVNQVLKVRYEQKEAELNNLKLQIRPHFLYNNLESIRALAELEDKQGIIQITAALGSMLRYSINNHNEMVRVAEEVKQVQHYLKIEQIRSGNALCIEIDVEPEALQLYMPPFLLQPIVENSIQHGFASRHKDKAIYIGAKFESNRLILEVQDNGSGIPSAVLKQIKELLDEEDIQEFSDHRTGIGLKNVHSRLELMFGQGYGILLNSTEGKGTNVTLILPTLFRPTYQKPFDN